MGVALHFLKSVAVWAAGFVVLLTIAQLASGDEAHLAATSGVTLALHHTPHWLAFAIVLCAFPAGLAVAREIISERWELHLGKAAIITADAVTLALVVFLLGNFAAPAALRSVTVRSHGVAESSTMTLPELLSARDAAFARARSAGSGEPDARVWLRANQLDWQIQHRRAMALLTPVLAWLGVLAGAWVRRVRRRELRLAHLWGAGFFILLGVYGFLENSYEAITIRMAGPAPFAGWFVAVVPGLLLVGLAWPTSLMLWGGKGGDRTTMEAHSSASSKRA